MQILHGLKFHCICILFLTITAGVFGNEDWDDLFEGEKKLYGSEKEEKLEVNALFWEKEKWDNHYSNQVLWLYKHINYPKFKSTSLFPFYYSLSSKIDNREKSRVINYFYKKNGSEVERFFFPFVYHFADSKKNSQTLGIFPIVYYHSSPDYSHTNLFWLFGKKSVQNKLNSLYAIPLFFWNGSEDGYFHIPPLLTFNTWNKKQQTYFRNFMIFYFAYGNQFEKTFFGPIYYHNETETSSTNLIFNTYWTKNYKTNEFYINVFPLFSYHDHPENGIQKSFLLTFSWNRDKHGNLESYNLFPFFYRKNSHFVFFPFYFSFDGYEEDTEEKKYAGPFYYIHYTKDIETKWVLNYYNSKNYKTGESHFAFFPFYFSGDSNTQGNWKNILFFWGWKKTPENELGGLRIFPFIFYKKESYFAFFPFYFSFVNENRDYIETTKAGPFYYINDSLDSQTKWIFNYYSFQDKETGYSSVTVFPFYHKHESPSEKKLISFSPLHYIRRSEEGNKTWALLYYSHENFSNQTSFKTLFPLIYGWENKENSGDIFLPFYLNYKEGNKTLHLNIAGFSIARQVGTLGANLSVGRKKEMTFADFEIICFYNLFSFSTRKSFSIPSFLGKKKGTLDDVTSLSPNQTETKPQEKEQESPKIVKEKSISREKSENFWGWSALFGIAAYERADTKRHIRVLPLGWFSWDKESDDRLYFLPLFNLWYVSDELEYKVFAPLIIPLYAKQRTGKSFIESYLTIGYVREFDEKTNRSEHSVLWPLTNFYTSDETGGSRILPIYWYKRVIDNGVEYKKSLSLLHYYKSTETIDGSRWSIRFPSFLPLFYFSGETEKADSVAKWWIFPVFACKSQENKTGVEKTNFSIFHYYESSSNQSHKNWHLRFPSFFPLLVFSDIESSDVNESKQFLFPVFYHKRIQNANELARIFFIPGFYYETSNYQSQEKIHNSSTLWMLLYYRDYFESISPDLNTSAVTLTPLFYNSWYKGKEKEENFWWVLPFFIHEYSSTKSNESTEYYSFFFYWGKTHRSSSNGESYEDSFWVLPFYTNSFDEKSENKNVIESSNWVFPIYSYSSSYLEETKKVRRNANEKLLFKESFSLKSLFFYYFSKKNDREGTSFSNTIFFPIIPLFYRSVSETKTHYNLLWFIDWKRDILAKDFRVFVLGLYLYSSEEYSRQNFLYLIDHQYRKSTDTDKLKLFLGTIHFEKSPEHAKFEALWGFLAGYESREGYYDINFLWLRYLNEKDEHIKLNLLPLFYHDVTPLENVYIIPPLLSYSKENDDQLFQLGGLGLLWYRNYDKRKEEETKAILLGTVYYEVRLKERGYRSRGSFWGVLWEYQTETETDYSKFSFLKFVYSNTTNKGQTYNRIFGIKL